MQVPGYWKFEKIGEGCYADIYRGEHITTRSAVAIKKIKEEPLTHRDRQLLESELRASRSLKHKGIIRVMEHVETEDNNYLILTPLADTDLLRLLNSRSCRISEESAKDYFVQIIQALRYSHLRGIVHLDIK